MGSEQGCEILPCTVQILTATVDPSTTHQSALDVVTLSVPCEKWAPDGIYPTASRVDLPVSGCEVPEGRATVCAYLTPDTYSDAPHRTGHQHHSPNVL